MRVICLQCLRSKPPAAFYKPGRRTCKDCSNRLANDWRRAHPQRNRDNVRRWAQENPKPYMLIKARTRAKARKVLFDLSVDDIRIPKRCPILGIPILLDGPADNLPSLDRIDNDQGYVRGNVHVVSWRANDLKRTATFKELVLLGKWAAKQ